MELSSPKIKNFLISYNLNIKFFFLEKKFLIFFPEKAHPEKISCISCISGKRTFEPPGLKAFLYFLKKSYFIFWKMELSSLKFKKYQEGTFQTRKIKKTHSEKISYISGNGTL